MTAMHAPATWPVRLCSSWFASPFSASPPLTPDLLLATLQHQECLLVVPSSPSWILQAARPFVFARRVQPVFGTSLQKILSQSRCSASGPSSQGLVPPSVPTSTFRAVVSPVDRSLKGLKGISCGFLNFPWHGRIFPQKNKKAKCNSRPMAINAIICRVKNGRNPSVICLARSP